MPLNIKNPQVEQLAAEVAKALGSSKTEAIRLALVEKHERLKMGSVRGSRAERLQRFLAERVWPTNPPGSSRRWTKEEEEAALGYGEHGEPV